MPTRIFAKLINLLAIPPTFINCPAKIKNGIARRAKLSSPVAILCEMVVSEGKVLILISIVNKLDMPMLNEIGTPTESRAANEITRISISNISI